MKKIVFLLVLISFVGFKTKTNTLSKGKIGMVKVMILYPNEEGKDFNMNYYVQKHMPMVAELFGTPLKGYGIEEGITAASPEETPYVALGYFLFDSLEDYHNAFVPNAKEILGDIPNYTSIKPVIQINNVLH